jgi:hypothetical protein
MNFSIKNNSFSRPVVLLQRLFESTGRLPSIDTYFLNASPPKLIRFERAGAPRSLLRQTRAASGFIDLPVFLRAPRIFMRDRRGPPAENGAS